ncbi:MAG: hypothetical protein IPO72_03950 [Saprospiraceae bacterium]|nr:hypothetical protein [Candidatus Vicinibacter affinis]
MSAAIESFREFEHNEKWVVLGKMAELGDSSQEEHQNLTELLVSAGFEKVILIGSEYNNKLAQDKFILFENVDLAKSWIYKNMPKEKLILIKGSRSSQLEKILTE